MIILYQQKTTKYNSKNILLKFEKCKKNNNLLLADNCIIIYNIILLYYEFKLKIFFLITSYFKHRDIIKL